MQNSYLRLSAPIGADFSASVGTEFDCKIYASTAFKSIFITKFYIVA